MFTGKAAPLSQQGIDAVLGRLGVDAPALWAVLTVETSGCGFLPDRRPKILFERHCFSRLTNRRFDEQTPDISHRSAGATGRVCAARTPAQRTMIDCMLACAFMKAR